jgi:hypothetical protein
VLVFSLGPNIGLGLGLTLLLGLGLEFSALFFFLDFIFGLWLVEIVREIGKDR